MRVVSQRGALCAVFALAVACGGNADNGDSQGGSAGQSSGSGGTSGGNTALGGTTAGGGITALGGTNATGGATNSGGATTGKGGATGSGGALGKGGTTNAGGAPGSGGAAGDAGSGGGLACGARAGDTCTATEYCAYVAGQYCGAADAQSTCKPRPQGCPQIYMPVCGCDYNVYGNSCEAAAAGSGVRNEGGCPEK
ncbi:MAG: hypothetical protein ACOY0T_21970 [Myxococcota bacterium]